MKILVVGKGGREHALCWRLSSQEEDDPERELICAPGSDGIAQHARCVGVPLEDPAGLAALAAREQVDLVVVGPEAQLAAGLVDRLELLSIPVLGPSAAAARLESSKIFAKGLMDRLAIPTPRWRVCDTEQEALSFGSQHGNRVAVKLDGLAAGKGVVLCSTERELLQAWTSLGGIKTGGDGGSRSRVIVEQRLFGEEASAMALCDGERALMLAGSQDHKAVGDGGLGPNTGGMGAFSPTPLLDAGTTEWVKETIVLPVLAAMRGAGTPFRGILYAGLMIGEGGPQVLEFNVRFGDPEAQVLMLRWRGAVGRSLLAAARGALFQDSITWRDEHALCVVLASEGYPGVSREGRPISGLSAGPSSEGAAEGAASSGLQLFHAGTRLGAHGFESAGGRVLSVAARGESQESARRRVYDALSKLHFEGMHFRSDIGTLLPRSEDPRQD